MIYLTLWRVLSLLTLGGEDTTRILRKPGADYALRRVEAHADSLFCLAVLDEAPHRQAYRVAMGCAKDRLTFTFTEDAERGGLGKFYMLVVFSRYPEADNTTVVITTEIERAPR